MVTVSDEQRTPAEPLVLVQDVDVVFGAQHVLRNVNLTLPRGQTLAIIGESGCGKTVLMKTMIGLIQPTRGHVYFDGADINRMSEQELSYQRRRLGFVFQQAALFDSMTIGQNVAFPLIQHTQQTMAEISEIVFTRLAQVGLPDSVVTKKPAELSGGMRKRVGLARALAMNPELMLYDEPTTGLDPIMSDVINELMIGTRDREHVTSIIVTHDMKSAMKVADRVVMVFPVGRLAAGESQVIFDGTPDELEQAAEPRVRQFTRGEAGERLMEMRRQGLSSRAFLQ
ncbi:MAG: ABC transporter ATP-binding protein [Pirellulaceae bacterium]|nr:ABC transporter ATP-binding protein [Planctomycetales bacterium]